MEHTRAILVGWLNNQAVTEQTLYNDGSLIGNPPEFREPEIDSITELHKMFDGLDYEEWTEEAVKASRKWEEIRMQAKHVLVVLGVEYSPPDKKSI